jgi:hypothetical protein
MSVSRYTAEQGQTVKLGIQFENAVGALYDPADVAYVEILDVDSNVIDTIPGGSIVHDGVGIYYVEWAIPAAETLGKHYDRWYYTPLTGGTEITAKEEFYVYAAGTFAATDYYITVSDAKARCLIGTALSDPDIQYLIRVAMAIIDKCAGQHFLPLVKSLDVDGTGEGYVVLPKPLLDYRIKGTWIIHKQWRTGAVIPAQLACLDGGYFPRGHRNIRVTGRWGIYEDCPVDITHATCLLLKYAGQWDEVTGPIIAKYERETVTGWSYGLRKIFERAVVNRSTGHPDVDLLIQNHRRTDRGVAVI